MGRTIYSDAAPLYRALRVHFSSPAYGLLTEVRDKAGFDGSRSADALVMGLWKSRGYHLHGIEIKASRTDWLRELKNPAKADPICKFCDHWWIVTLPEIVRDGELPKMWGLLTLTKDGKLREEQAAPSLTPEPIDRSFLASVFRRSIEQSADTAALKEAEAAAYQRGKNDAESRQSWKSQYEALEKSVEEFEQASGLDIRFSWRRKEMGKVVALLLDADAGEKLSYMRDAAKKIVAVIDEYDGLGGGDRAPGDDEQSRTRRRRPKRRHDVTTAEVPELPKLSPPPPLPPNLAPLSVPSDDGAREGT